MATLDLTIFGIVDSKDGKKAGIKLSEHLARELKRKEDEATHGDSAAYSMRIDQKADISN